MSYTSTSVKRKYNEKTYKRWYADIKISEFEQIEQLRKSISNDEKEMSRAAFLKMLINHYKKSTLEKAPN